MSIKKIVIITTGQPSTNPRAIKEATALASAGYEVSFIYNFWAEWGLPFDKKIKQDNPAINWIMAGADPVNNKAAYNYSRLRHKYYRWLNKLFPKNFSFAQQAAVRGFSSLCKSASKMEAALYIAHNLGALPVAAIVAKKYNSKYAFDAEDYHRGQSKKGSLEYFRTILLEDRYLPGAAYFTAASPLIGEQYTKYYQKRVTVINNVFSLKYQAKEIKEPSKPLKLFWFSQTIGKGRGLEDIILALKEMPAGEFSLTLLGNYDESTKKYFSELGRNESQQLDIEFLHPLSAEKIFEIAAQHDIGLALETGKDENNKLALSNKIFTYLLAGNAIIFSDTKAQQDFYLQNSDIGFIYKTGNIIALKKILSICINNLDVIQNKKEDSFKLGSEKFNWEIENRKFVEILRML